MAIALDTTNNIFVISGNEPNLSLTEVAPDGDQTVLETDNLGLETDYVDPSGDVFVNNYQNLIYEYSAGEFNTFGSDLSLPNNLTAPSPANTIYLSLLPSPGAGGIQTTGTVTLSEPATATTHVRLSSSDTAIATVPASVTVKPGLASVTFQIATVPSATVGLSTIIATTGGKSQSALVEVLPCAVATFTIRPLTVTGGAGATGTLKLNGPAPTGGATVSITDDGSPDVSFPGSVVIPAGQQTGTFTISTTTVSSTVNDKFFARYNGGAAKHTSLTINP